MKKNKKAAIHMYQLWGVVAGFSLVAVVSMVIFYLMYIVGNDYIVFPMYDIFQNITVYSSEIINASVVVAENYQNTNLGIIDLGFFLSYILLIVSSFKVAYKTRRPEPITFLSLLFYGIMLIMFVLGFILIVVNWIYADILQVITAGMVMDLPWFTFYLTYLGIIFLFHAIGLLMVNQMDFNMEQFFQRKRKEVKSIELNDGDEFL